MGVYVLSISRRYFASCSAANLTLRVCRAVVDFSSEEPGKASLVKNIGNVILFTTMETVAECHVFAEKSGLGVGNMQKLLEALLPTGPALIYSRGMMSGSYHHETVRYKTSTS